MDSTSKALQQQHKAAMTALCHTMLRSVTDLAKAETSLEYIFDTKKMKSEGLTPETINKDFQQSLQNAAAGLNAVAEASHSVETVSIPSLLLELVDSGKDPDIMMKMFCEWTQKRNDHSRGRIFNAQATAVYLRAGLSELRRRKKLKRESDVRVLCDDSLAAMDVDSM